MDFEARLEAFYMCLDLKSTRVVDVGAHSGRHTIPLACRVGAGGVVHAFEPLPEVRRELTANIVSANLNNVVIYPFALGAANDLADFNFIRNLPEESGLRLRHVYNAIPSPPELIKVPVYRLDDVLRDDAISFLKADIEGGELDMLRGAVGIIRRSRPVIAFECGAAAFLGYHDTPETLYDLLAGMGFLIYSILGDRIADARAFRTASFEQTFWDYIAIPQEKSDLVQFFR